MHLNNLKFAYLKKKKKKINKKQKKHYFVSLLSRFILIITFNVK